MYLISTRHESLGKCNSDELCHIIEQINPNVIFEEIPPSNFDEYYKHKSRQNLESNAIKRYILNNKIKQIPVDSNNIPSDEFFKSLEKLHKKVEGLIDYNGFNYRKLTDRNQLKTDQFGFKYLNSIECINTNKGIYESIENGLQTIKDEALIQTFNLWKEINSSRENIMLQNIYKYSEAHSYDRAIFLLGAAHRESFIEKTKENNLKCDIKINWIFEF
ncbi:MAG: hypothetical protein MH472_07410 [Bacteroidia bacterium]|nr:hypothetical protein [Bacteroidia bacterium]